MCSQQANQILDEADRIEDAESKRHQLTAVNVTYLQECEALDGSLETVGLITISAKAESLGQINTMNSSALRMFGYTARDIVGRNLSTLIPEPFGTVHNKYATLVALSFLDPCFRCGCMDRRDASPSRPLAEHLSCTCSLARSSC